MKISAAHVNEASKVLSAKPPVSERPAPAPGAPAIVRVDTFERTRDGAESPTVAGAKSADLKAPALAPAQAAPVDAQDAPTPGAVSASEERTFNAKDREALLAAWGAQSGQERFSADYDLDGDGRIGSADLALLLGRFENSPGAPEQAPPVTTPTPANGGEHHPDVQSLLAAFGRRVGDEGFDEGHDLDGDGRITSADLARLLGRLANPGSPAPVEQAAPPEPPTASTPPAFTRDDIDRLTALWGRRAGDKTFNATYDLDGDGAITSADLARLLGRLS